MNILVLASDIPATTNMPGSPRLFSICRLLARRHRLTLMTSVSSTQRLDEFRADPASQGVFDDIILLPHPPAPNWLGTQAHRLRMEPHFSTRVRNKDFHARIARTIEEAIARHGFDVLYADGLQCAQYVMDAAIPCPALMDLHDSLTMLYARKAQVERHWIEKLRLRMEMISIRRTEQSLGGAFGVVVTNSEVDEQFLQALAPGLRTLTIGNGVDCDFFHPSPEAGNPDTLLFTGVMSYRPNADAAEYFSHEILPLIRQTHPNAEFHIVGKDPSEQVRALGGQDGVRVLGEVPDVRPHVAGAGIFVCPLRWGAGVKNKLLAALAMEKPVVATRQSISGMHFVEDEHLLIAEDAADFARQVVRLMDDPALARRLAEAGRAFVIARYSWLTSASAMESALAGLIGAADASG